MDQLGAAVSLEADLDGKPVLELDAIYREHSATVSKWVRRLWGPGGVSGSVDAEDLLQEVFLVVQRRLDSFRFEAALTTCPDGYLLLNERLGSDSEGLYRRWEYGCLAPQ